jgi:hypothetical protein
VLLRPGIPLPSGHFADDDELRQVADAAYLKSLSYYNEVYLAPPNPGPLPKTYHSDL